MDGVNGGYDFDPCTLDNSQHDKEEEVTLDNWKPSEKRPVFRIKSEWRQKQLSEGFGYMNPGIDEIKKIRTYLKNKQSDIEILDQFGINADTLFAIKMNRYDPVEGIIDDQVSLIFTKTNTLEKRIESIKDDKIKPLTKSIQELTKRIDLMEAFNKQSKMRENELTKRIELLENQVAALME